MSSTSNDQKLPKGFISFILTQSFGAFNDNFFKMLLQLYVLVILMMTQSRQMIALAVLVFTIPFVLFGPWAGYLADKHAKSNVIKVIKLIEIVIMGLGVLAFSLYHILPGEHVYLLIFVLFLMASQSAFFAPAKAGFIPETCAPELISKANGIMGMTTFFAIILGTACAGLLLTAFDNKVIIVSLFCVGLAIVGAITSFFVTKTKPSSSSQTFLLNPFTGIVTDIVFLKKQRGLFLAALANSYFWLLGLMFQTNVLVYGSEHLGLGKNDNTLLSLLPAIMGVGIALGSMLASRWSGKKVEIGLVPFGGFGMCVAGLLLFFTTSSYLWAAIVLGIAGVFGGLYVIPLNAYLQFEAGENEKGRVMATAGVLNGLFLVLASLLYQLFAVTLKLSPAVIFLIMSVITILVTIYICTVVPEYFVRFLSWLITHTFYRIKIKGSENVPFKGPALLVPNHVSFVDALLVGATIQRFVKFIMYKKIYELPIVKFICKLMDVIPIAPYEGRESVTKSLELAREKLKQGEVVCIFAEGAITRDGDMHEFKSGFESIMDGVDAPIIPLYLDNVWGSVFSFEKGKAFWKWPKKIPYPITITYGKAMPGDSKVADVQLAVERLKTHDS